MDIKDKIWLGFNLFFAFGGTLFAIIAWNSWNETYQIVRNGIKTQGLVLENVHRPTRGISHQTSSLAPIVMFTTTAGEQKKYYSQTYTTPATHAPGDVVDIWYLPDNPVLATMNGVDAWVLPTVFGIFGAAMCLIGYSGLIGIWLKKNSNRTA